MATEIQVVTDPTGWIFFALAACACVILLIMYVRKASPTGPFRAYFKAKEDNRVNGGEKAKALVLILINVESRLVEYEYGERVGPVITRENGVEIYLTGPNTIFYSAGVPIAFVFTDKCEIISPAAAQAITTYAREHNLTNYKEVKDAMELDENLKESIIQAQTIVPFSEYHPFVKDIPPSTFYKVAQALLNFGKEKTSFIDMLLSNPILLVAIGVAILGAFLIFMG